MICDIQLVLWEDIFHIYCCGRFQAAETVNSIAMIINDEHSSMKVEHSSVKVEHSFLKVEQRVKKAQKKG